MLLLVWTGGMVLCTLVYSCDVADFSSLVRAHISNVIVAQSTAY